MNRKASTAMFVAFALVGLALVAACTFFDEHIERALLAEPATGSMPRPFDGPWIDGAGERGPSGVDAREAAGHGFGGLDAVDGRGEDAAGVPGPLPRREQSAGAETLAVVPAPDAHR